MTDLWMWGLIASLILLAIGTTLKSAHDAFLLKQSDKEVARLRSEIESLNKTHHETISGIQQSNSAENEKLVNRVTELERQLDHQRKKPIQYPNNGGFGSWMG
ncbi:MAG: hypothetical protein WA146_06560 [Thiobacillus sp.]